MNGKTLGHYRVGEQLGRGSMGEVYVADDTALDRKVALKFLPEAFTGDPERMARFEREAKVLASLNHQNIAAIYGLEQAEWKRFIVMELVEGETLAQRLNKGALAIDEALGICRQIAEGLEAAHEKGVIHRDLKPANVMITEGEKVKILDFGLAKALSDETQGVDSSHSPTLTEAMTRPGVILGTAAYMSPEQAKGKAVDKRADIWAFGCILYECLTGRKAFGGETVTETLATILKGEPDWSSLPATTPPNIRFLIRRCLGKDVSRRFRDAADVRIEIEEESIPLSASSVSAASKLKSRTGLLIVVLVLIGSLAAGVAVWRLRLRLEDKPVARVSITLPSDHQWPGLVNQAPMIALSPDGTRLAYVSSRGGASQIYIRRMDSFEAEFLAGTEGAGYPFFSPDGQWLGFSRGSKLMKVPVLGGASLPIADASFPMGASWGENGMIILSPNYGVHGLMQVSEEGGNPTSLTKREASESEGHRWPQFLPGSKVVLFTAWRRNVEDCQIVAYSLETGHVKVLVKGGTYGRYIPTGHLVYAREGNLFAVPFDTKRLELQGAQIPILQGVMLTLEGAAQFSFSKLGTLAYLYGGPVEEMKRILVWIDRAGKEERLPMVPRPYAAARLSPDGNRIALMIQGTNDEIWTYDIPDQKFNKLTFEGRNASPLWTPDGKRITFRSDRGGTGVLNLWWMPADGGREAERLTQSEYNQNAMSWSRDGKSLIFNQNHPTSNADLWILPLNKQKPYPLSNTRFVESGGIFSPDGLWIAYVTNESGRNEVYIRPFSGSGGVRQVSSDGGNYPIWARTGELFYLSADKMMSIDIKTTPTLKIGTPRMLFKAGLFSGSYPFIDVTPDGQRFLVVKSEEQEQTMAKVQVIFNWFEEIKKSVRTR